MKSSAILTNCMGTLSTANNTMHWARNRLTGDKILYRSSGRAMNRMKLHDWLIIPILNNSVDSDICATVRDASFQSIKRLGIYIIPIIPVHISAAYKRPASRTCLVLERLIFRALYCFGHLLAR